MAKLFTVTFEVGGAAPVGTLAAIFADLGMVAQIGLDLAGRGGAG